MKRRDFLAIGGIAAVSTGISSVSGEGLSDSAVSSSYVTEPEKRISVVGEYDVCVLGGSCTGVFAAVRAAQMGAKVAIVEKQNAFGGVAASGLVNIWHSLKSQKTQQQIIGGLTAQTLEKLKKIGAVSGNRLNTEELKIELDRFVVEHDIQPYLHTNYVAPKNENGRVQAGFTENKNGQQANRAKVFVDATGDGDLAKDAGLPFDIREGLQPPTTCSRAFGMPADIKALYAKYHQEFGLREDHGWDAVVPGLKEGGLYALTHVFDTNASDAAQLTKAEIEGRRQVRAYMDIARQYGGDRNKPVLLALPSYIGIRETRSFSLNYKLTQDDVLNCKRFPDAIANGTYHIDVHDPKIGKPKFMSPKGDFYQIPLSTMISDKAPNIVLAGRMISSDRAAFGAIRVMVNLNQTGEAAGVTAALAASGGKPVFGVDSKEVRNQLSTLGAVVI